MLHFNNLVTPLLNRRKLKSVEQSFTTSFKEIEPSVKSAKEAGQFLGFKMSDELSEKIEKAIQGQPNIIDLRYIIALNIKRICDEEKTLYKVDGNLAYYEKLKKYAKLNMK